MKKTKLFATILAIALIVLSLGIVLSACDNSANTIVVGASATPHAVILQSIEDALKAEGYTLKIKIFDDYILPNTALEEGELDANYFQHTPYLEAFNSEYDTHLAAVAKIHYEPLCIYGKNVSESDYAARKTGRTILIPNDGSNLTRALFVLQDEGFITLKSGTSPQDTLSVLDIAQNNGNDVRPIEAKTIANILKESPNGTLAVINGNYALEANLDIESALALEDANKESASLYANVIAVRVGDENSPKTAALIKALRSQTVIDFIKNTFKNSVLPVFTV